MSSVVLTLALSKPLLPHGRQIAPSLEQTCGAEVPDGVEAAVRYLRSPQETAIRIEEIVPVPGAIAVLK